MLRNCFDKGKSHIFKFEKEKELNLFIILLIIVAYIILTKYIV